MYFSSFFSLFSWELETRTDLNSNKTSSIFNHFNFTFLARSGEAVFHLEEHPEFSLRIHFLSWRLCALREGTVILLKWKAWDLTFWSFGSFTSLFSVPLSMRKISSGSCCHGTKQDEVSTRVLKLDVYGRTVKNYPFWQVGLVYAELTQHHSSSSKVERGSSGHSLCVKANVSFSSAGKGLELALSFHSLVSCSNEQPLHALPSSWLALEGRSIWSSINVSFKIMRAREEGN